MITTIYSKPLLNGGREFLIYNDISKFWARGNTASTAISHHNYDISIDDVTIKQLKHIANRLNNLGFTEHNVNWRPGVDTYGDIQKYLFKRSK